MHKFQSFKIYAKIFSTLYSIKKVGMIDFLEAIKTSFQLDKKYRDAVSNGYHPIDRKLYNQFNRFRPNGAKQIFWHRF